MVSTGGADALSSSLVDGRGAGGTVSEDAGPSVTSGELDALGCGTSSETSDETGCSVGCAPVVVLEGTADDTWVAISVGAGEVMTLAVLSTSMFWGSFCVGAVDEDVGAADRSVVGDESGAACVRGSEWMCAPVSEDRACLSLGRLQAPPRFLCDTVEGK